MIAYLCGEVLDIADDSVILLCGGVGYQVYVALGRLDKQPAVGDELALYTYLNWGSQVAGGAPSLFGFASRQEIKLFNMLNAVSGIGAKTALSLLNHLGYQELVGAIQMGNAKLITSAPGVGKKAAERILLELGDKIMKLEPEYAGVASRPREVNSMAENLRRTAMLALVQLGYHEPKAAEFVDEAIANLDDDAAVEDIITAALKIAARG